MPLYSIVTVLDSYIYLITSYILNIDNMSLLQDRCQWRARVRHPFPMPQHRSPPPTPRRINYRGAIFCLLWGINNSAGSLVNAVLVERLHFVGIMEKYFDIVRGRNVINLLNRSIKIQPSCLICMPTSKMFINGPKTGCDPLAHRNFHSPIGIEGGSWILKDFTVTFVGQLHTKQVIWKFSMSVSFSFFYINN